MVYSLRIVLTHEHADAVLGLDDIRVVQPHSPTNDIDPTAIYLTQYVMDSRLYKIEGYFPSKLSIAKRICSGFMMSIAMLDDVYFKLREGQEVRRVAQLDWRIIEDDYDKPFVASGLKFVPLPVMHGEDYICLDFLFGEKSKVAYISDVSRFPSNTEYVISKSGSGQLDLLILDCLYKKGSHNVHLCLPQVCSKFFQKLGCPEKKT
uniref:Metallo-beta-lactamase domain-containing protein n=1 Tax=Gossypium raimondii TaxID=29730 RepID=A0A0D2QYK9_GOSRA|nr:hypothetical protein B456_007G245400 [Gossypium raimondii]